MNWKPHTEQPGRAPQSVLIALIDEDGGYFLTTGIYLWSGDFFRDEATGVAPCHDVFWWIPESELLEGLPDRGATK